MRPYEEMTAAHISMIENWLAEVITERDSYADDLAAALAELRRIKATGEID